MKKSKVQNEQKSSQDKIQEDIPEIMIIFKQYYDEYLKTDIGRSKSIDIQKYIDGYSSLPQEIKKIIKLIHKNYEDKKNDSISIDNYVSNISTQIGLYHEVQKLHSEIDLVKYTEAIILYLKYYELTSGRQRNFIKDAQLILEKLKLEQNENMLREEKLKIRWNKSQGELIYFIKKLTEGTDPVIDRGKTGKMPKGLYTFIIENFQVADCVPLTENTLKQTWYTNKPDSNQKKYFHDLFQPDYIKNLKKHTNR